MKYDSNFYQSLKIISKKRMIPPTTTTGEVIPDDEFQIEQILKHTPKFGNLKDAAYTVKWMNYDEISKEKWENLQDTKPFEEYILSLQTANKKKAIAELKKRENQQNKVNSGVDDGKKPLYRKKSNWTRRINRKKYTGKKITTMELIGLQGKGGCYCFMPYDTIDANQNAMFKIGMSLNFKQRAEQYHTYFPNGVYNVAFLADPPLRDQDKWSDDQIKTWREKRKQKSNIEYMEATVKDAQKSALYKEIEKFLFKYVSENYGQQIYATTRVKFANKDKEGVTEWVFGNEDVIHEAFEKAHKVYGGELKQFYLSGFDSNTGKIIESINDIAEAKKKKLPSYTGQIIFNI